MNIKEAATSEPDTLASYKNFPFSTDEGYQQGLKGILTNGTLDGKSDEEQAHLLRLSRVFYFNRLTCLSISAEDALRVEQDIIPDVEPATDPLQLQTIVQEEKASRILTFTEIKELIEQGKTDNIPNNRVVPDILNDGPPSESKARIRAKPWESSDGTGHVNQN